MSLEGVRGWSRESEQKSVHEGRHIDGRATDIDRKRVSGVRISPDVTGRSGKRTGKNGKSKGCRCNADCGGWSQGNRKRKVRKKLGFGENLEAPDISYSLTRLIFPIAQVIFRVKQ